MASLDDAFSNSFSFGILDILGDLISILFTDVCLCGLFFLFKRIIWSVTDHIGMHVCVPLVLSFLIMCFKAFYSLNLREAYLYLQWRVTGFLKLPIDDDNKLIFLT